MSNSSIHDEISRLKKTTDAVVLAHTYQPGDIQDVADYVGDSYGLSVAASKTTAQRIIFCGVRFMAETASILNPDKTVILAEASAGCPMADMIDAQGLTQLKDQHPGALVACYVNSSAEVKALCDVCVTSSNAVRIISQLPADVPLLFVPDKHLGSFVEEQTGRKMILWNGFCPTHARITGAIVDAAKAAHPDAIVMIHPEAPKEARDHAHQILSTGQMCAFVKSSDHPTFIIATELGLIHTLKKQNPVGKQFFAVAETVTCPNMRKGSVQSVYDALAGTGGLKIAVPEDIALAARRSLEKMLELGGPVAG